MIGIHAEASPEHGADSSTPGQRDLFLLAGGPLEELALAVKHVEALTPLFKKTEDTHGIPGGLVTPLTWTTVIQLSNTFGPALVQGPELQAWVADELRRRTEPTLPHLPGELWLPEHLVPRDYQVEGAYEIARTGRALIFDEPRTGKTVTTILGLRLHALAHLDADVLPILVVCPASVVDPWVEHFETWSPWSVVAWRGSKRQSLFGSADVYVTSYDTATRDATSVNTGKGANALVRLLEHGGSLVVDESHYVKNQGAARSKAVRRLAERAQRSPHGAFVALSGTPITHHPADLWPTLNCLTPAGQPSRERMVQRYCQTVGQDYGPENVLGLHPGTEPEFRFTIIGQHRRKARADVMSQLPPKVYSTRTVDMPPEWRKVYDDFEAEMLAELPDGSELSVMDTLSVLAHLSSLASSAADVRIEYGPDVYGEEHPDAGEPKRHVHLDLKAPSWKVDANLEILEERRGEPVVVYAPSRQLIVLAGAAAAAAGHRVGYIVGGQSAKVRTENRQAFQGAAGLKPSLDVIFATTAAGGTGITLSRAETVVFLQRPWALVDSIQAEDRAEGDLNAARGTEVIDILTRNTIETRVRAVLRERAGQLADLVQDRRIVEELLGGRHVPEFERAARDSAGDLELAS